MTETIHFPIAIVDEPVFLLRNSANLTKSANIANQKDINTVDKNGLLILYAAPANDDMSPETLVAMNKLITAVNLKPEETNMVKIVPESNLRLYNLLENCNYTHLIFFGLTPEEIGLHVEYIKYKSFKFNNLSIVICDKLEGMEKQKRLALWNQLKIMFNVE